MEAEKVIEKKEIVHENGHKDYATKGEALGVGIPALALGGVAALSMLWGRNRFGLGGGDGTPANVNINTSGGSGSCAPTAFQAWEKGCDEALALTNTIWGLKVNTMSEMYAHRDTDVAEKFSIWKGVVDGDFGNYKAIRDLYDVSADKLNTATFGLYKNQRDGFDALMAKYNDLDKKVAVLEATRPYQDKLIQCEIDKAFNASTNYTDRKTCRAIYGVVGLPSTPTVTVLEGANPFGYNYPRQASA